MQRMKLALCIVMLMTGCTKTYSAGAGATMHDRPVYRDTDYRFVWGVVGNDSLAIAPVCPSGDALIAEDPKWLNYTLFGLFFHRTERVVYCRDDAYRTASLERARKARIASAQWHAERSAENEAWSRETNARWDASRQESLAYGQPVDRPAQPQQAQRPRQAAVPQRSQAHQPSQSSNTTYTHNRVNSRAIAYRAQTQRNCQELIPEEKAIIKPGMDEQVKFWAQKTASDTTDMRRRRCYECVSQGKHMVWEGKPSAELKKNLDMHGVCEAAP